MVNISDIRYVSLEPSGEVTVSFTERPDAVCQMILDSRWMPQIQEEIPRLENAAQKGRQEFQRMFRDLMAACEGY